MPDSNRGPIIAAAIVGAILVAAVIAPIFVAYRLEKRGLNPYWMFLAPHNAYIVARNRREIEWQGIRIRVDSNYVIDPNGDFIRIGRINAASILFFDPALSFRPSNDSSVGSFERERDNCRGAKPSDSCTAHDAVGRWGNISCIEHRSHRPLNRRRQMLSVAGGSIGPSMYEQRE